MRCLVTLVIAFSLFGTMLVVGGVVTLLSPNVPCARTGAARTLVATSAIAILRNMTSPFCHLGPDCRPRGLIDRFMIDLYLYKRGGLNSFLSLLRSVVHLSEGQRKMLLSAVQVRS